MKVLFAEGIPEIFASLPLPVQKKAAAIIDLVAVFPEMYPVRRRGLMKGYRYFVALDYLFYYSLASNEIRLSAIIPGRMREA